MRLIFALLLALTLPFARTYAQTDRLTPIIGATLMVGWPGTSLTQPSTQLLCQQLSRGQIGGVLFLAHNMRSPAQVQQLTTYFSRCGARTGALLAVDQEGGRVDRLGRITDGVSWPSAASVGERGAANAAALYSAMAAEVAALGFNVNFGPVADLNTNPNNPIIGRIDRAYGVGDISAYLNAFIAAHEAAGVATALKHFPGHGASTTDSHRGFTDISGLWQRGELSPFQQALGANRGVAVMAGHLVNTELDSSGLPATLSQAMLSGLLRGELRHRGVIVSDDMEMRAITDQYGFEASVQLAMSAGIDLFIHANAGPYHSDRVEAYHAAVRDALARGMITEAELRAKRRRLSAWRP